VINFELDRTIQHIKQSLGQIKRLSVAVVVNHRAVQLPDAEAQPAPISEDEIARITSLVRDAVGYSDARGDTISVVGSPFAEIVDQPLPVWKDPQVIELSLEGGKYLGLLILLLFAYFAIIRPLMRTVVPPVKHEEPGMKGRHKKGRGAYEEDEGDEEGEERAGGRKRTGKRSATGEQEEEDIDVELSAAALLSNEFDARLERARLIARENPKSVAELLNQWLGVNEEGAHK
jgi:flagellar M-ring protein FliF